MRHLGVGEERRGSGNLAGIGGPVNGRAKSLLGPQGLSSLPGPVRELRDTLESEAEASENIAHPALRGGASRSRLPRGSAYNWGPSLGVRGTQPSSTNGKARILYVGRGWKDWQARARLGA